MSMSSRCFQGKKIDTFLISANLRTVCYGSIPSVFETVNYFVFYDSHPTPNG